MAVLNGADSATVANNAACEPMPEQLQRGQRDLSGPESRKTGSM